MVPTRDDDGNERRVVYLEEEDARIDAGDYQVVDELFRSLTSGIDARKLRGGKAMHLVDDIQDDGDYRVRSLALPGRFGLPKQQPIASLRLPESLLKLDALEKLKILRPTVVIPPWIGRFRKLSRMSLYLEASRTYSNETESIELTYAPFPTELGAVSSLTELSVVVDHLPDEIGKLSNLRKLEGRFGVRSISGEIGKLQHLETLSFRGCSNLDQLPEAIGALTNLVVLDLFGASKLRSLPATLGNLIRLKHLDLGRTESLQKLPESIGNLSKLEFLNLSRSGFAGQTSSDGGSLGKLRNLRVLKLSRLEGLTSLPETIGNLTQLEYLTLEHSGITELPESFGNLTSLQRLDLSHLPHLRELPTSFGNLARLTELNLDGTTPIQVAQLDTLNALASLETLSFRRPSLQGLPMVVAPSITLQVLHLDPEEVLGNPSWHNTLSKLIATHPRLGCLGDGTIHPNGGEQPRLQCKSVAHELVRNRARTRLLGDHRTMPAGLWPRVLEGSQLAFATYPRCRNPPKSDRMEFPCWSCSYQMTEADRIFRLLSDYGGKFLPSTSSLCKN